MHYVVRGRTTFETRKDITKQKPPSADVIRRRDFIRSHRFMLVTDTQTGRIIELRAEPKDAKRD